MAEFARQLRKYLGGFERDKQTIEKARKAEWVEEVTRRNEDWIPFQGRHWRWGEWYSRVLKEWEREGPYRIEEWGTLSRQRKGAAIDNYIGSMYILCAISNSSKCYLYLFKTFNKAKSNLQLVIPFLPFRVCEVKQTLSGGIGNGSKRKKRGSAWCRATMTKDPRSALAGDS